MGNDLERMPVLFVGHGSPMNAIEDNQFTRTWEKLAREIPRPKSVLCLSAHFAGGKSLVVTAENPKTIHDFYGFPEELNQKKYPTPGSPELAQRIMNLHPDAQPTNDWGLDHGAWSILCHMYPQGDIPVVQMSLDLSLPADKQMDIGKRLEPLRNEGVLLLGSGNIAHNLGLASSRSKEPFQWASAFDEKVRELIDLKQYGIMADYMALPGAGKSVPTTEHFVPLLYVLGALDEKDTPDAFCTEYVYGSISMTGYLFG